jgi:signal peptidase I
MEIQPEVNPNPEPTQERENKGSFKRFIIDLLETLVLSVLLFLVINAISARIRIESISMQPTLYEGDFVIVNRLAYKLGALGRGDVIVFKYPPDPESEPYIKRVIGLPGDIVQIEDGNVYVNDILLREPYLQSSPMYNGIWYVPNGNIFVLGDNRNHSSDSHAWGMVPIENIIGKALVVYWPLDHWQVLNPSLAAAAGQ